MTVDPQISELISGYLSGVLSSSEVAELERWIDGSPEHAAQFATAVLDHRSMVRILKLKRNSEIAALTLDDFMPTEIEESARRGVLQQLADMERHASVELVSISDLQKENEFEQRRSKMVAAQAAAARAAATPSRSRPRVIVIPYSVFWGSLVAMLLLAAWVTHGISGTTDTDGPIATRPEVAPLERVAVLEGAQHAIWAGGLTLRTGQPLDAGEYRLTSGTVRLRMNNGALAVIESPARFTLKTSDTVALHDGGLVSFCDTDVETFVVQTPYATYTDLGTEFGVLVHAGHDSQLHVFKGSVRVNASDADPLAVPQPVTVRGGQAVVVQVDGSGVVDLPAADSDRFETTRRYQVETQNTGEAMDRQGVDRAWRVTHINGQEFATPSPAVLMDLPVSNPQRGRVFMANRVGTLAWITPDPALSPNRITTTRYTTEFDLGDLDPATARLDLGFLADNFVSAIVLNGRRITVPPHADEPPYTQLIHAEITDAFVAGTNRLEIVVENVWVTEDEIPSGNYTGLIAELEVTAQPHWRSVPTAPAR